MNRITYLKEKLRNKRQFNDTCVESFEQELLEIQYNHSHVVDIYFCEHYGAWVIRTECDGYDLQEYETKAELVADLPMITKMFSIQQKLNNES